MLARRPPRRGSTVAAYELVNELREHLLDRRRAQEPFAPRLHGGEVGGGEAVGVGRGIDAKARAQQRLQQLAHAEVLALLDALLHALLAPLVEQEVEQAVRGELFVVFLELGHDDSQAFRAAADAHRVPPQ
jgi:hypothetical protein